MAVAVATDPVPGDPDDPAIWVNRADPPSSLVFGTVKEAAPLGALAVFTHDGRLRELITGIDRPNNVDVDYGLPLGGVSTDIAVLTERYARRLRAFAIAPDGRVRDVSGPGLAVMSGVSGDAGAPMGIGLYRRPADGALFAIVAPKSGPPAGYLWQYRLADDGHGRVGATFVRRFGNFSGTGEIEAVAVDDALDVVYYADEDAGLHAWRANPDAVDADRELGLFATTGYQLDREGIGIYARCDGTGYLVSVDQRPGNSTMIVYRREGGAGRPNDHGETLLEVTGGADATDGLDVTSAPLGAAFPDGLLVAMNSSGHNFLFYRWGDVARRAHPALATTRGPCPAP